MPKEKTGVKASGTCERCGRFSSAIGFDAEDAERLARHNHGWDYKHSFRGEMTFSDVDYIK